MTPATILGILVLVIGVPLNLYVLGRLRGLHREDANPVLAVLIVVWTLVVIVAVVFGLIFVNNDQGIPPIRAETTKLITRAAVLALVTLPAVSMILVYRGRS